MKIYNTMSRQKEEFVPIEAGKVKIYVCGPTVYNYIHIGNARPFSVFDVLRRYLEYKGYEVTYVQNFTDIDDKIIKKANEEGKTYKEISEKYIEEYNKDVMGLGIKPPTIAPKATEAMDEIIEMVKGLIEKGYAYEQSGDVYFSSGKFEEYGKLSGQNISDLCMGSRVGLSELKCDNVDFAIWKSAKEGEPYWESPWGKGRPGWHIECSAMVEKYLGKTIDIHSGGQDLIFPHHENEIAQSECFNGTKYVNYWMHVGYINVDNKKMSKSLDNFFTVRDVAEKFGYEPIKFLMLQAHYRSPINYNLEIIEQCKAALDRLHTCRNNLDFALKSPDNSLTTGSIEFLKGLEHRKEQFEKAMDEDLNTADALAAIFDLVKDCNLYLTTPRPKSDINSAIELFDKLCDILGILYEDKQDSLDSEIEKFIEERQQARKDKNFARADEIRDELKAKGIILEDTPQGIKYHFE